MKKTNILRENELKQIISKTVRKVLKESFSNSNEEVWNVLEELEQYMDDNTILTHLISRIGLYDALQMLNDIKETEIPMD